ncbi:MULTISPECIES: hypothetical protein [Terribacillus]|uniref:hypothetical protein n=1 Tax=Terribacillus TaxID=459532 RepID=UPI00117D7CBA|nr:MULTISPECIES: hypothetical protein [Terribacillus]QXE00540.1 hypothetical protein KS242_10950 [Terribacillus sp. DMT04]
MRNTAQQKYLHYVEAKSEANMASIFSEEKATLILRNHIQHAGLSKAEVSALEDKYRQDMHRIFEEHGIL